MTIMYPTEGELINSIVSSFNSATKTASVMNTGGEQYAPGVTMGNGLSGAIDPAPGQIAAQSTVLAQMNRDQVWGNAPLVGTGLSDLAPFLPAADPVIALGIANGPMQASTPVPGATGIPGQQSKMASQLNPNDLFNLNVLNQLDDQTFMKLASALTFRGQKLFTGNLPTREYFGEMVKAASVSALDNTWKLMDHWAHNQDPNNPVLSGFASDMIRFRQDEG